MRILIIEDNAIQALTLEMILKNWGFSEVEKAFSSQQAFQKLNHFEPDLMLVDINLGSTDTGVDIVKKVQELNPVRVLYITGNSDEHHRNLAKETDHIGYMVKPVHPSKLKKILAEEGIKNLR